MGENGKAIFYVFVRRGLDRWNSNRRLKFCDSEKIEGFRPVWGGFKNLKFSHFGTPNGSNFAILRKLKGSAMGGDSKTLNLATSCFEILTQLSDP